MEIPSKSKSGIEAADEQPWIEETLLEFCTFPAARHDDCVDAASQALLWLLECRSQESRPLFLNPNAPWEEPTEDYIPYRISPI